MQRRKRDQEKSKEGVFEWARERKSERELRREKGESEGRRKVFYISGGPVNLIRVI